jgi:hypothetical protein
MRHAETAGIGMGRLLKELCISFLSGAKESRRNLEIIESVMLRAESRDTSHGKVFAARGVGVDDGLPSLGFHTNGL